MGIIEDPKQAQKAQELAARRGLSVEEAISVALNEALERTEEKKPRANRKATYEELAAIAKHCATLPVYDNRAPDDILGYNEYGIPE